MFGIKVHVAIHVVHDLEMIVLIVFDTVIIEMVTVRGRLAPGK